jgi:hypothetical protein
VIRIGIHPCGLIVIENSLSAVCAPPVQLSVARTVKTDVPALVGVPEMTPEEPIFRPAGNVPAIILKLTGAWPPDVVN